jgi:hypothetical protein
MRIDSLTPRILMLAGKRIENLDRQFQSCQTGGVADRRHPPRDRDGDGQTVNQKLIRKRPGALAEKRRRLPAATKCSMTRR